MSMRLPWLAVVVALFALAACSDEDPPAAPTNTAPPTQAPAALSTPTDAGSESQGLPPDDLRPVDVGNPQVFLSGLSDGEQSCLSDNDIGPQELLQMTGRAPGGSPETTTAITNCLQDETVLRLFLTTLVGQVEPFSQDTSGCIREGFVPLDLRGLLAPAVAGNTPANSLALGIAALNVAVVCMNDDEWETYAPRLGMQPDDREGAACLFEELGGPAQLVEAMQAASLGETPEDFIRASQVCGLDSFPPSGAMSIPTPVPAAGGLHAERDREVRLAGADRTSDDDVL